MNPDLPARLAGIEAARILALRNLRLLDSGPEQAFDDIVRVAATICDVPIALVSLVDHERIWFKARIGTELAELEREGSFCAATLERDEDYFEVEDALDDPCFRDSPLVTAEPNVRFYAGVSLISQGVKVGTLCVVDTVPRQLTAQQRDALVSLARATIMTIEYRHAAFALAQTERHLDQGQKDAAVFAAVVAHAQDAIMILGNDPDTGEASRITYVNAAFSRLLGRDFSKMIGRSLRQIATQSANQKAIDRLFDGTRHDVSQVLPLTVRIGDGSIVTLEMTVSPLPQQSPDAQTVVVLRDLSARRARERAALSRVEEGWRGLFARTPAIAYTLDRELRFTSSTGGGLGAIGLEPGELDGRRLLEAFDESEPDVTASRLAHERALAGESVTFDHDIYGRKFKIYLEPQWTEDRLISGVAGIAFDVTEFVAKTNALAESEAHVARTERTARTGSWMHDLSNNKLVYSSESLRMFGLASADGEREAFYRRIVPEDRERVRAHLLAAYESGMASTHEFRIIVDESIRFVRESVEITSDALGRPTRADGIFVDITERRLAELDAFRRAYTDDVTGLPNRSALRAQIESDACENGQRAGALLMINVDRFRSTNDVLGRTVGDRLLRAAGARLSSCAPNAYVARVENDTFAVLLAPGVNVESVAKRLHAAFRSPFDLGETDVVLTVSVGIALAMSSDSADTLSHKAEVAMREARGTGGDRSVTYSEELERLRNRRVGLERDLHKAVERSEFELHYQPIIGAAGAVVALEALLRWQHPVHGRIAPDEFIPIAEENGAIVSIGRWVLHAACEQLRAFRKETGVPLRVAVNVSARQFSDVDLIRVIAEALAFGDLPASALEIEITESTIAIDAAQATRVLSELRAAGVTLSVDDFGTGYSSLANLRRFPIDNLKIDRSFVAKIPEDVEDCAIVEAIVGLARQLSLAVIAEGVETQAQAGYLMGLGCEMLQGYHFARPLVPREVVRFVRDNRRALGKRRHA